MTPCDYLAAGALIFGVLALAVGLAHFGVSDDIYQVLPQVRRSAYSKKKRIVRRETTN